MGRRQLPFGDAGYQGVDKREEVVGPQWHVAMKRGKRKQLNPEFKWARLLEQAEQLKASVPFAPRSSIRFMSSRTYFVTARRAKRGWPRTRHK
jgi:IS5 family transposase